MSKPKVELLGADGNIFNLMAIARRALIKHGMKEEAKEMIEKATKSESYTEALSVLLQYVDPIKEINENEFDDIENEEDEYDDE